MLIDSFAPEPDAVEVHRVTIHPSPQTVHRAIWTAALGGSIIVKGLLGLRALPGMLLHRDRKVPRDLRITLQTIINSGFGLLTDAPEEILLGVNGRYCGPIGNLLPFDLDTFRDAIPP